MRIKESIKQLLKWKLYHGKNKIGNIGNNVSLPFNLRVSGGG